MGKTIILIALALVALFLQGCGNGTADQQTGQALLKLGTQGTVTAGSSIGSIDNIDVTIPAGVSVPADASGKVLPGAIYPSGQGSSGNYLPLIEARFVPSVSGGNGTLTLKLVNAAGFATGEFATITCSFTGNTPSAADFTINQSTFRAKDLASGADLNGLTANLTLTII
jgi:hypothetical protein